MSGGGLGSLAGRSLRQGWSILAIAFGLSAVVNALRLVGPLFMILIYDRVLPSRSTETLVALFLMLVVFLGALALADYARRRILARFGAQFQERMETALCAAAGRGAMLAPGRTKPAAGLDQVDGLRGFFHSSSLIAIYDFIWTPLFVVVIFVLNPLLGWVAMGGSGVIGLLVGARMGLVGPRKDDAAAASQSVSDLRGMVAASGDAIRNQDMARGFMARWLTARAATRDRAIALKDWTGWFDSLCDLTVQVTRYSVLGMGAWLTLEGSLSIGAMVAATFLVSRVLVPVEKFLTELPAIHAARGQWGQLVRILAGLEDHAPDLFDDLPGNPRALLSMSGVQARNPAGGELILKGITLDIGPGQIVQITGMTGRGKTVLAEVMMGLWRRSAGSMLVMGNPPQRLGPAESERIFGYMPETPGFIAGTLAENIARLDPQMDPQQVAAAARRACLHARISSLPDGYQTQIDAAAHGLSRGQRSQLALARAVYHLPKLLILDEPDPMLFDLIPKTMDKTFDQVLDAGGAIIILARKPVVTKRQSLVFALEDGRLKPQKPPARAKMTVVGSKSDAALGKIVGG